MPPLRTLYSPNETELGQLTCTDKKLPACTWPGTENLFALLTESLFVLPSQQSLACSFRIPHAAVRPVQCKRSSTLSPVPPRMHPAKDLPAPASPEETSMEKSLDLPQCTVPLAHTDTAEDSLLVGLALSQVFAHNVSTQAEAHNNQLGLRVGLLDVINHGTKFPGAT